ncbi:MBL fold metallo-hydrolase [Sulfurovum sp. NBC37-1]|uniref:MBL fold metallo-hydrolase n=1 Tax=Sulfurovum sp. (strain NBC37-1) TaxID=387093 RepID=UPI0001587863|nr:MBL fold metallo-hydrolase [Sulfurovum sp. NBC37-1]BAF71686.1 hypothetical protein SUN_0727 [Sulfurovum sp. NBC37-1]
MEIKFLKAYNGDAIYISYHGKNIIIDTGTGATYSSKRPRRPKQYGELKDIIDYIKSKDEKIDLLIITHLDDDHIGGVLKWFDNDIANAKNLVQSVWFNSGVVINKYFESQEADENNYTLEGEYNPDTSIKQGVSFEQYLLENRISNIELIKSGMIKEIEDMKFIILSPTEDKLKKLLKPKSVNRK